MTTIATPRFATPVDESEHGAYRIPNPSQPLYRFTGRLGSPDFPAEPGRYHLYAGWFCPWAHRVVIDRALLGLQDVIGLSYVDDARDGRGWAFREHRGPDGAEGFTLLRQAYEATDPGYDGHVSVPTLWDTKSKRIVSNDFNTIGLDLALHFTGGPDLYPCALRDQIDQLNERLLTAVNQGVGAARTDPQARLRLSDTLDELAGRLAHSRYLFGDALTESDVRLWVTLVRFDAQGNADGKAADRRLVDRPVLWAYARDLYQRPAFRDSTDFASFATPGYELPDWDAPSGRG